MAETSSSGPSIARARFGPLELVSAIFIEVKCHSLLHRSGNKLRFSFFAWLKYSWKNILIF
jgi:hypothetical protein